MADEVKDTRRSIEDLTRANRAIVKAMVSIESDLCHLYDTPFWQGFLEGLSYAAGATGPRVTVPVQIALDAWAPMSIGKLKPGEMEELSKAAGG